VRELRYGLTYLESSKGAFELVTSGLNLRYWTVYSELWYPWVCQPLQSNARMTLKLDEGRFLPHVRLSCHLVPSERDVAHYVCAVSCVCVLRVGLSRFVLILLHELFVTEHLTNVTDSS
jgi:hypothetical protein